MDKDRPKLLTTQVNVASRPWATVTFSNGNTKSGSNARTAEKFKTVEKT